MESTTKFKLHDVVEIGGTNAAKGVIGSIVGWNNLFLPHIYHVQNPATGQTISAFESDLTLNQSAPVLEPQFTQEELKELHRLSLIALNKEYDFRDMGSAGPDSRKRMKLLEVLNGKINNLIKT